MTATPDPESMLARALEPYEPPRTPALFGRVAEASIDLDYGLLERRPGETLLEVVAEALAASYGSTTFATAGALIVELEKRGLHVGRRERIQSSGGSGLVNVIVVDPPRGPSTMAFAEDAARIGYARGLEDGRRGR